MQQIPKYQVVKRIQDDNGWWRTPHELGPDYCDLGRRAYFSLLYALTTQFVPRRAVLLLGPRRVGKTVLMHQVVAQLIADGVPAKQICYLSVDHPIFNGNGLEELLELYAEAAQIDLKMNDRLYVLYDEIQYLKDWEVHLKALVDRYANIKFLVSGSSAAALRLKSSESGAGRFTDFLLPPLTFHEYLELSGSADLVEVTSGFNRARDITALNQHFLSYLNFGGYPEVMFSKTIQKDPGRFIKSDIIDRVLLRDLPSLYGIQDIQELNSLFTTLAYNTATEVSLEKLSKTSGVAKNTIKRYIEYLEAAFLVKLVHRIDRNAGHFSRINFFKVYLTNPSMWAALFQVLKGDDPFLPLLTETAIFAQWFHEPQPRYYARWDGGSGEVDIVGLTGDQRAAWALEVKWSDRYVSNPGELKSLLSFCSTNNLASAIITTVSKQQTVQYRGIDFEFVPASLYCWTIGHNIVTTRHFHYLTEEDDRVLL